MAEVEDYTSGKILRDAKIALLDLKLVGLPVIGRYIRKKLLRKIEKFEPKLVSLEEASTSLKTLRKLPSARGFALNCTKTISRNPYF